MYLSLRAALMLISGSAWQPQSVSGPRANKTRPVAGCDREQAQKLIAQQGDQARKLTDPGMRVSVLTIIADRLWPYDEPRARALFREADDIGALENALSAQRPQSNNGGSPSAADPRFMVIEAVARHDTVWARRLIDNADQQLERNTSTDSGMRFQHQRYSMWQLQQLALSLLSSDEAAAIDFMRDSFRFPVAGQLPLFLFQLASRNQQAADALYQDAFQVYRGGDITAILALSAYPFGLNQVVGRPLDLLPKGQQIPAGFTRNSHLQQVFLEVLFERAEGDLAALARREPGLPTITLPAQPVHIYAALQQLDPAIQRYQPALAEKAASLRSALGEALPPNWLREARQIIQLVDQVKETDFDANLAGDQRQTVPDIRDNNIANAVVGYSLSQPLDSLCAAAQRISDEALRRQILDWLYFQAALRTVRDGMPDDAAKIAVKLSLPDLRVYLTYEIAAKRSNQTGNKRDLTEIIDPILKDVVDAPSIHEIAIMALTGASRLYARGGDSRAFEVMASAIEAMNAVDLEDPALASIRWRFDGRRFSGGWSQILDENLLPEAFRQLAGLDHERAVVLARKIRDRRSQAIAVTALALHCLEGSSQAVQ